MANFYVKSEYIIHIKNLKDALNQGLVLKKYHKMPKFNQNSQPKLFIDMNTDLRKKREKYFEKDF